MDEKELKALLIKENEEFGKVYKEHQHCEKKLEELKNKGFLTEQESLEEKDLKKKKLFLKDRMYSLMDEYRKSRS